MRKIYKYPTGAEIPKGAVYLSTVTQTSAEVQNDGTIPCRCHDDPRCSEAPKTGWVPCWLVWHYFLVELNEEDRQVYEHQQTRVCGTCSGLGKNAKTGAVCMACLGAGRFIVSPSKSS